MQQFTKRVAAFLSVLLICFLAIEFYLGFFPSAFQIKADYLEKNKSTIQVLILGSSHNQTAINPEYLSLPAANIAFSGQDLKLDWLLLNKKIKTLSNLKYVLLELSYHTLEMKNKSWYERNPLYLRFYNINNFERRTYITDYSIFLSDPPLYLKVLNPFFKTATFNKYGFETSFTVYEKDINRFEKLNYDSTQIDRDSNNIFISRHRYQDIKAYHENCKIFNQMITLCLQNNIVPLVVITPVYKTYAQQMIPAKKNRRDLFLSSILKRNPKIKLIDFESNRMFSVKDFMNQDHLNPQGAEKFSNIINTFFNKN